MLARKSEHTWKVGVDEVLKVDESGSVLAVNLDLKNPNVNNDLEHKPPAELAESILAREDRIAAIMEEIKSLLAKIGEIVSYEKITARFSEYQKQSTSVK